MSYRRTYFASQTDGVIVVRLEASQPVLHFTLGYDSQLPMQCRVSNHQLTATIEGAEHEGVPAGLKAVCDIRVESDGTVKDAETSVTVDGASVATLYITAATNYVNYCDISGQPALKNQQTFSALQGKDYPTLLQRHIQKYQEQFQRVSLQIGETAQSPLPTDERLAQFKNSNDMGLVTLMFQYGRYLLISSSQPGGQPANLQGVWNDKLNAPWDSKYTININAEMNYWPA